MKLLWGPAKPVGPVLSTDAGACGRLKLGPDGPGGFSGTREPGRRLKGGPGPHLLKGKAPEAVLLSPGPAGLHDHGTNGEGAHRVSPRGSEPQFGTKMRASRMLPTLKTEG